MTQDGRKWPTVEHFYHASKFHGGQFDEMISKETSLEEVNKLYIFTLIMCTFQTLSLVPIGTIVLV